MSQNVPPTLTFTPQEIYEELNYVLKNVLFFYSL